MAVFLLLIPLSISISSFIYSPWAVGPYKDAAEKNVLGGLTLEGFLSEVLTFIKCSPIYSIQYLFKVVLVLNYFS